MYTIDYSQVHLPELTQQQKDRFTLSTVDGRLALATQIREDIDTFSSQAYQDAVPRRHVGASMIGKECARQAWYEFRGMVKEQFNPRMLRIFNYGHRLESFFLEVLRGIGCEIQEVTDEGIQFKAYAVRQHFSGSCDGFASFQQRYGIPDKFLLEFKSKCTGAGFNNLNQNGVEETDKKHWAQLCTYGCEKMFNVRYALYLAENKNDSSIAVDVVELDNELGLKYLDKAEFVINSQVPPPRILSASTSHFVCKYCPARGLCLEPESAGDGFLNCRSCRNATPVENAQWHCAQFNDIIPVDFLAKGCNNWIQIETHKTAADYIPF